MANLISLVAGLTAIFSLLTITVCGHHWVREYTGLGKPLSTLAVSFGIVVVYYVILVAWFCHLLPLSAAGKK
jgi:hypothetical protein